MESLSKKTYHIGISGSYGGLNMGDEAILQNILKLLRQVLPNAQFTVFTRNPDDTRQRHGIEHTVPVRKLSRNEVVPEIESSTCLS